MLKLQLLEELLVQIEPEFCALSFETRENLYLWQAINMVKFQFPEELLVRFEPDFRALSFAINVVKFLFP